MKRLTFLKTFVFENDRFENDRVILKQFPFKNNRFKKRTFRFSLFRRRFHNETIGFF